FLAAAWAIVLARSFGATQPILGVAQDGRKHPELHGIVGPWTKYVPVRLAVDPTWTVAEVTRRFASEISEAHAWQEYYRPAAADCYLPYALDVHATPAPADAGALTLSIVDRWCCPDRFDLKL